MSEPIRIETEEDLLQYFGQPGPVTVPQLPPDFVWLPVNGLAVGYAPSQELKVVRISVPKS